MLVTVLMPMRNAAAYVRVAALSVLAEKLVPLELLIIDDGSTDASVSIISSLGDPRIRVVPGPQKGIAACMNAGLAQVRGEVIMRCDADDIYPPGRIARQVVLLDSNPDAVAVCGGYQMIDDREAVVLQTFVFTPKPELINISTELENGNLRTHLCTFAIRHAVLDLIIGFREYFETAEDIDFAYRLGAVGKVIFCNENFYQYRIHSQSITHAKASSRRIFFDETALEFAKQRLKSGVDDLMNGKAQVPPPDNMSPYSADQHLLELAIRRVWQHYNEGCRSIAFYQAWQALCNYPSQKKSWVLILKLTSKCISRKSLAP